ncbi:MAG TPA: hypothetical protein VG890_10260 [Puia sp.]|nr:hypothetical protein [Puia sp.]
MAQNQENLLLRGTSGTIDKMITYRQRAGKTIVSKKRGKSSVPATAVQLSIQERFKKAVAWAKGAIKDAVVKAKYQAKAALGQSAFNVATVDAYNPPKVESIDTANYHGAAGDTILVKATDDFAITGLTVSVANAAGDLIESGDAVMQVNETDWLYTATKANAALAGSKITATAKDGPGNVTAFSVTL